MKINTIDTNLSKSADAHLYKMQLQVHKLEQKLLRAEKRKYDIQVQRIRQLKDKLFPGHSLQERVENFMEYYLEYGPTYFNTLYQAIQPIDNQFTVVINSS